MDGKQYDQTRNDAVTARWMCNLRQKDRITANKLGIFTEDY